MSDYWESFKHWLGLDKYSDDEEDKKSLVYLPVTGDNLHDIWNDYEALGRAKAVYEGVPYISDRINARMYELEAEENERWWSDYEKNTGMSRDDNPYPIRGGYYRYAGSSGISFDVNYSIMALYNGSVRGLRKLRKRD